MEVILIPDEQSDTKITSHFEYIYADLEGWVCLPTLDRTDPNPDTNFKHHWFEWPQQKNEIVAHVEQQFSALEVYYTPAVWNQPKLNKVNFKASQVIWTEFDGNTPTSLHDIPNPTYRIESSGPGFEHFYWKVNEAVTDASQLEALNRAITYRLGADASAWDATQVLRIPNTINHKRNAPVRVISKIETAVQVVQFGSLPAIPEPETTFDPTQIPSVTDVILRYPFPDNVAKLFQQREFAVGQRSTALMQLGYSLAEMGLNDAEIFSVLRNADDRWGKFKDRRDRDKRLVDLIAKARIKHPEVIEISEDVIPVFGFQSLLNTEAEISWVVPNLLQEKGYMLLTGPSGVGKTQFSLQIARHMALGKSYLGFEFERKFRLLFWSLEMGLEDIKYFASLMGSNDSDEERATLEQNLLIAPLGEPLYLDSQSGQTAFCSVVEQLRPDGVFVDSLGSTSSSELSSESTAKTLMDFNDRFRKQFNCFTWFIHHHRKATADNKKPNKQSDVYGNQYIVNRATSVYALWPSAGAIDVIPLKKRLGPLEESWQVVRNSDLSFFKKEKAFAGGTSHLTVVGDEMTGEKAKPKFSGTGLLDGI